MSTTVVTMGTPPPGQVIDLVHGPFIGYQLNIVAAVGMVLSTFILALRLYTRQFILRSLGMDDLLVTLAWFLAMTMAIADIEQTKYGTGRHLWNITIPNFNIFLILQVVVGMSYQASLGLSKASILTFYLRLSPEKWFRVTAYSIIGFVFAYTCAGLAVIVFSCKPIAASWDVATSQLPETVCVNRPADYLAQASFNIIADIAIFVMPLRTVWGLQLPLKQKVAVIGVFAAGLFVCIISMVRLKSVINVLVSTDLSWDTNGILIWSTIEAHVTIACACVPTLRPLLQHYFPGMWGKSSANSGSSSKVISGRSHKLKSQSNKDYPLQNFSANERGNTTVVGRARDQYDLENESQERIIDDIKFGNKGVYVTKTVQVQ